MQRKFLPVILLLSVSVLSVNCQTKAADAKTKSCRYLTLEDAEKILGQPVKVDERKETEKNNTKRFDCIYSAQTSDSELRVLFSFEEFANETEAKKVYQTIWDANKNHAGIQVLKNVGDEAYFHTDNKNFSFVMAREGKFTIRFKVRKITETTSFEALKAVSKKIIKQI